MPNVEATSIWGGRPPADRFDRQNHARTPAKNDVILACEITWIMLSRQLTRAACPAQILGRLDVGLMWTS